VNRAPQGRDSEGGVQSRPRITELWDIVACPVCQGPLSLMRRRAAQCRGCGESFPWLGDTWNLMPSTYRASSDVWAVWDQLQANGLVSYREDPEHNLAVGARQDCVDFSVFCRFKGLVLDVGCGPQPWPAYFRSHTEGTRFVGVDPLIETPGDEYLQLRAVAEYLPIRSGVFDHVVFATSLDHFVDPRRALNEAQRVCRATGEIDVWIGEKDPGAPLRRESPTWYLALKTPTGAQDTFHLKRLALPEAQALFAAANLWPVEHDVRKVDDYRNNHFFRLKPER